MDALNLLANLPVISLSLIAAGAVVIIAAIVCCAILPILKKPKSPLTEEREEECAADEAPAENPETAEEPFEEVEKEEEISVAEEEQVEEELSEDEFCDEPETEEERNEKERDEAQEEEPVAVRVAEGEGENLHYVIKRYQKGFMAKLIQSDATVKHYYSVIKNELLSYDGIKSRETWNHESFAAGRSMLAKLCIRGKTLSLFLALDPKQIISEGKYAVDDFSHVGIHSSTPTRYRIKSLRRLGGSKWLIKALMKGHDKNEGYKETDWAAKLPYADNEELAKRGLVKVFVENEK